MRLAHPRRRAIALAVTLMAVAAGCSNEAELDGESRAAALADAIEQEDWQQAYAIIEASELSRADKNGVRAAVLYRRGEAFIDGAEYGRARLAFIEARRLSGNPAFFYDEARAWRGMRNRKLERQYLTKYLAYLPEGPNANDARARLKRIALKPIERKTPQQLAAEEAAAERKAKQEAQREARRRAKKRTKSPDAPRPSR